MEYKSILLFVLIILLIGTITMMSVEMIDVIKGSGDPRRAIISVTEKLLISFAFFLIASATDYRIHGKREMIWLYYTISVSLLVSTFFFPARAHRWIRLGGFSFQPSELVKIFVIVFLSSYISRCEKIQSFWHGILKPLLILSPIYALVALEPDLSTTVILIVLSVLILYTAGAKFSHVLILVGAFLFLGFLAFKLNLLKSYQLARLSSFLKGRISEQVLAALSSARSGGVLGKGINLGELKMTVPVVESDFVMAAIGEELGLFGIAVVLLSYLGLVYSLIRAALKIVEDSFGKYVIIGYAYLIMIQVMVNVGVSSGILPITGVTLPFISSGGSSLMSFMIGLGIVVNIVWGGRKEV